MSDEEDWSPPSEAELKVIQAKRERSDKISKLMGDYLLKVIFLVLFGFTALIFRHGIYCF